MRYDLYSLDLFVAVAAHLNIARAAEAKNIAASAVSKRISDLEQTVGAPLLYRRQRGVELTPAGEELLRYATSINRLVARMDADMSAFADGLRGHVRIAANTSAVTQFLPEDLAEFVGLNPEIKIELSELTSEEIVASVRDGFSDIGVYSAAVDADDLDIEQYRTDTLVALAPVGHALDAGAPVSFAEVAKHDIVGLQPGSSLFTFLQRVAQTDGIDLKVSVEVTSFDGVRRMVQAGLGVAILPYGAVEPYLENASLAMIAIDEPWSRRKLMLAVRDKQALTRATRALADHLVGRSPDGPAASE